ncbi:MAG: hypothetical protein JWQ25_3147 [Daejeonella sp.]|nr:hypothetical protein [Daejeonella sp.]
MRLKIILLVLSLIISKTSFSQIQQIRSRVKVYAKDFPGDSVILKSDNELLIPVKLTLIFKLDNLEPNSDSKVTITIPPKTSGKVLTIWKPISSNPYKWTYTWSLTLGDSLNYSNMNDYSLPFIFKSDIKLTQEPGGNFSHQGIFAYDFAMPTGTPVLAAKTGLVILVKDDSALGGYDKKCLNQANYVFIYHADGTVASYVHLNTKGVVVTEGEFVSQGQLIGYSGNTGYSDGPHLHFELLNAGSMKPTLDWKTPSGDILSQKTNFVKWYKNITRFLL